MRTHLRCHADEEAGLKHEQLQKLHLALAQLQCREDRATRTDTPQIYFSIAVSLHV